MLNAYRNNLPPIAVAIDDPKIIHYLHGHPIVMYVQADRISRYGFKKKNDPYISALASFSETLDINDIKKILIAYYQAVQCTRFLDFFCVDKSDNEVEKKLKNMPVIYPWESVDNKFHFMSQKAILNNEWLINKHHKNKSIKENVRNLVTLLLRKFGLKIIRIKKDVTEEGFVTNNHSEMVRFQTNIYGSLSMEKINIEASRLKSTFESIRDNGFERSDKVDGDIECFALVDGDENPSKFIVRSGHHRFASLIALGYEKIPIRVFQIVSRKDVLVWPKVVDGTYNCEVALKVFDAINNKKLPVECNSWIKNSHDE